MRAQRVVLLPTNGGEYGPTPRRAMVLAAPDDAARARAARLGPPVLVCPELAAARPDEVPADRVHRLDALVRGHAVTDRWRDLLVVADADTIRDIAAGLCDLPGAAATSGVGDVVTVGLPRGARPVPLIPVLVGGGVVCLLALLTLDLLYPLLLPGGVAGLGLLLLPWARSRHLGRTLLAAAGFSAVLLLFVVAGASRFPAE